MATGDQADFVNRLAGLLPASWFEPGAGNNPVRDAELSGAAANLSWIYSLYSYTLSQTRIATATGVWLDRIAWDFFGPNFPRRSGETDSSYRARIKAEILRPRQTRAAILQMLEELTGTSGTVQEPWNPQDWGGYGQDVCGYGQALGYGSLQYRNQIFVQAVRPSGSGIPNIAGYGTVANGYGGGNGQGEYCDLSQVTGPVTDAEIYQQIAQTVAAGTTAWTDIVSAGSQSNGSLTLTGNYSAALSVLQDWF
jgi:hypothetical protein